MLSETLSILDDAAHKVGSSTLYLCGGAPRDKYMDRAEQLVDIDITTGDRTIHLLGSYLMKLFPNESKRHKDGHVSLVINGAKVDLSSNFQVSGIKQILQRAGLKNPTDMQSELYSRDFTCNALLLSMDLKNIYDPTGLGINDINKKRIRTCLPAAFTLGSQNKRVVRVLYLAAKLGFDVDSEIIDWVKKNPESIARDSKPNYISEKIQKAMNSDAKKTIKLITEMGLWRYIGAVPALEQYRNSPERV